MFFYEHAKHQTTHANETAGHTGRRLKGAGRNSLAVTLWAQSSSTCMSLNFCFGAGLKLIPRATDDETPPGNGPQAW